MEIKKIRVDNPFNPIVYVHWKNDECLYVGHSGSGFFRPFSSSHRTWKYRKEITHTDIYYVETKEFAINLERELSTKLAPIYDRSHFGGRSPIPGIKNHIRRLKNIPNWTTNDEKVKLYIHYRFPKKEDGPEARSTIRLIHAYYREGKTEREVATELGITRKSVNGRLWSMNKRMRGPLRFSGRPKRNGN